MKLTIKLILTAVFIVAYSTSIISQTKNPFLERSFWRKKVTIETIQQKINEGHSILEKNIRGYDALSNAILNTNNLAIVKLLVNNGAKIEEKILRSGRTPAFLAVYKDNYEVLNYLISKGAKTDVKDVNGYSLIMYAASSGASDVRIYDLLLDKGVKLLNVTDKNNRSALLLCAGRIKDMKMIDYFLAKGLSIHNTDKNGNGVFNYAARGKKKDILEALIKRGASYKVNLKTNENAFTHSTRRSRGGNKLSIPFLNYLEGLGLDPKITTKEGNSCLNNISFSEKNLNIFKFFIKKGGDPNKTDKNGNIPLLRASYRNTKEVISYLLSFTKDINHQNKDGYTALGNAIRRNKLEVVKLLIKKGANINVRDKKGNDLGSLLVDSYKSSGKKAFHNKMQLLIKHGYQPKKATVQNGNSLLQLAVRKGNSELVKIIIDMGIPIDFKNDEGYTPLHVAVMTSKDDLVIKKLLEAGADKRIKTEFGESVYELAMENETFMRKKINLDYLK